MSRTRADSKGNRPSSAFEQIHASWATYLSNVYGWAVRGEEDALSVTIKCRGTGDWIGIAKRVGDDGAPEVCFGNAFDFVSCVLALNASMAAGRWRPDSPWKGGNGAG